MPRKFIIPDTTDLHRLNPDTFEINPAELNFLNTAQDLVFKELNNAPLHLKYSSDYILIFIVQLLRANPAYLFTPEELVSAIKQINQTDISIN